MHSTRIRRFYRSKFDAYMEDVKFFRATRVLSICTRTRVYATIVILRSLENVQFLRAKLYGDFLKCSVALWKKGHT